MYKIHVPQTHPDLRISPIGPLLAIGAYGLWGVLPIYWKTLTFLSPMQILCNRILWSTLFFLLILLLHKLLSKNQGQVFLAVLRNRKMMICIFCGSLAVYANWGLFIYGVNTNQMVQTSLGYFINPLTGALAGKLIFKEKFHPEMYVALTLCLLAIFILILQNGEFPTLAILITLSFTIYAVMGKFVRTSGPVKLAIESMMMSLFVALYLAFDTSGLGLGFTELSAHDKLWVAFSGIATGTPLLLFYLATHALPLSILSFIQYTSPIIQLFLGVVIYGEDFNFNRALAFILIWVAILIVSIGSVKRNFLF